MCNTPKPISEEAEKAAMAYALKTLEQMPKGYPEELQAHLVAMTKEVYGDRRTYGPGEETTANARLISAAPDLLEAAKLVIAWYEAENDHKGTDFWQRVAMCRESEDALRAAIAKATGAARATEGSATDAAECTCAAKDMPFGRCCKAGAA